MTRRLRRTELRIHLIIGGRGDVEQLVEELVLRDVEDTDTGAPKWWREKHREKHREKRVNNA